MAVEQETSTGKNSSGISRTGKRKWGYDCAQVDAFLERAHALYESEDAQLNQQEIQNISFDLCKGGYDIAQVDAALSRLERAVVDKRTTWELSHDGRVAWKAKTETLYRQIAQHAERNPKQRFMPGAAKTPSYDRKQVDRLIDQIVDKVACELGVDGADSADVKNYVDLNSGTVTNVIFTQRRGKRGYDERQVDYFLNSCITLLGRLESYARVGDLVSEEESAAADAAYNASGNVETAAMQGGLSAGVPQTVAPLFAGTQTQTGDAAGAAGTAGFREEDSFAQLHKAEQEIFTAPISKPAMPSIPPIAAQNTAPAAGVSSAAGTAAAAGAAMAAPVSSLSALVSEGSPAETTQTIDPLDSVREPEALSTSPSSFASQSPVMQSEETSSSLAALAHLAQVTQDSSVSEPENSLPPMPKLTAEGVPALDLEQSMSIPVIPPLPEPPAAMTQPSGASHDHYGDYGETAAAPAENAAETSTSEVKEETPKSGAAPLFPPLFPNAESLNVDIPDLSFPTFSMGTQPTFGEHSDEEENR